MLLSLMGLLNMTGSVIPPIIIQDKGTGHIFYDDTEEKTRLKKQKLLREDSEILGIIKIFLECQ